MLGLIAIVPHRSVSLGRVVKFVDSYLPFEMGGGVLVALIIVPKSETQGVVSLGVGTGLLHSIEDVGGEIDSARESGRVASGH